MTLLFRATKPDEQLLHPGSCWSEDRETAEAYTDNQGFGGSFVRSIDVDISNLLDISTGTIAGSRQSLRMLAEALGYDVAEGDRWFDNGWRYPWEESKQVRERLRASGFTWLRYDDDFPEGAVTIMRITPEGPAERLLLEVS